MHGQPSKVSFANAFYAREEDPDSFNLPWQKDDCGVDLFGGTAGRKPHLDF